MKAVRLYAVGDLRCVETAVPIPRGKELLIKVGACGICGSDIPRTYVHGTSSGIYPLTIGHEFSGEVIQTGEEADSSLIGARGAIFPLIPCRKCDPCLTGHYAMCENYDYMGSRCDSGFAEYCLIPSEWHLIRSKKAKMEELAMTEPACVAYHAVRRANVTGGQFTVIFGAGSIGILVARWVKMLGAEPLLVDIIPDKVNFALESGIDAVNSKTQDVVEEILKRNEGKLADVAIEGTGAGSVFSTCIECVRPCGTVAILGNPIDELHMSTELHQMILRKELTLNGVWNSSRAPYPVDEWKYVVKMIDEGRIQLSDLITDRMTLNEIPQAVKDIRDGTRHIIKGIYIC